MSKKIAFTFISLWEEEILQNGGNYSFFYLENSVANTLYDNALDTGMCGVVTDVQHRVSKQGKGWALFTIEDYTDSYEFRIFGEEYLKFRHFFVVNSFVYIRAFVKEGWVNRDTGKKGDPRIQFNNFQLFLPISLYLLPIFIKLIFGFLLFKS